MKKCTPKEWRSQKIETIDKAKIIYKDGLEFTGTLFFTEEGSWDEDDTPEFSMITDNGLILDDPLEKVAYIIDLDERN